METIELLKNKSDWKLWLTGTDCYLTYKKVKVTSCKKSEATKLIENKDNFIVVFSDSTANKYIKKFKEVGFELIEKVCYSSICEETEAYFEKKDKTKILFLNFWKKF